MTLGLLRFAGVRFGAADPDAVRAGREPLAPPRADRDEVDGLDVGLAAGLPSGDCVARFSGRPPLLGRFAFSGIAVTMAPQPLHLNFLPFSSSFNRNCLLHSWHLTSMGMLDLASVLAT